MRSSVLLIWLTVFEALAFWLGRTHGVEGGRAAFALLCFVWAGMLIAISLTEAWVKFKARLVERQVALDVGRTVFDSLNMLETAVGITLLSVQASFPDLGGVPTPQLYLLLGMLASQVLYLTPQLDLRALHIICGLLEQKQQHATKQETDALKDFKPRTAGSTLPPAMLHHMYVLMEFAKLGLALWIGVEVLLPQK